MIFGDKEKKLLDAQAAVCKRYGSSIEIPDWSMKVGVALDCLGMQPIRGKRLKPENGTSGWYIWMGDEHSESEEFYKPVHGEHLFEILPMVIPYLALAPGFAFVIDDEGYEDIWYEAPH